MITASVDEKAEAVGVKRGSHHDPLATRKKRGRQPRKYNIRGDCSLSPLSASFTVTLKTIFHSFILPELNSQ